tara:strand:- start:352 stop:480 length:129 start_codon:yes stop_codon:yes gene_type:complete
MTVSIHQSHLDSHLGIWFCAVTIIYRYGDTPEMVSLTRNVWL